MEARHAGSFLSFTWLWGRSTSSACPRRLALLSLITVALTCRLVTQHGHSSMTGDMDLWYSWGNALTYMDWRHFYATSGTDYLPGYLYVLWALGKYQLMAAHLPVLVRGWMPAEDLLYKLPAIIADTATVAVIYVVGRRWGRPRTAYLAALSYAVNPGVVFDSSRWGQVDSVPAFFLFIALVSLVESRSKLCGVTLALSVLCKPTALVLLPLFVVVPVAKRRIRDALSFCVAGLATGALVFLPFVPLNGNPLAFVYHCFTVTASEYPYLTVNAFNLWMLLQGKPLLTFDGNTLGGIDCAVVGWLLLAGFAAPVCIGLAARIHRPDPAAARVVLPGAAVMLGAFFIVLTRMHERHLLPTLPVLALTCTLWPRFWVPYCLLSGAFFLNLRYVFYFFPPYHEFDLSRIDIQAIALVNVTMLGVMFVLFLYVVGVPWAESRLADRSLRMGCVK